MEEIDRMKKAMLLLLTLALLVSGGALADEAYPETVDLTLYRAIFSASPIGTPIEEEWQARMEDYLGVKLNITWEELPFAEFNTKMPVYLAAGDWADAFLVSGASYTEVNEFGMQGMLVNLLDYLPEDSYYMQYVNASLKNRMAVTAADGNIYGFADGMKSVADAGTQHCWAVRFDTLEEHGIPVPISMEEILDVARQLKELYPDSYPVTIGEKDLSRWFQLYSSGLSMVYDGEKFVYAPREYAEDNYAVLEYLHTLSSEGLLDPEWMTDTSDQFYTKYLTGRNFISSYIYGSPFSETLNFNEEYDVEWGMINMPATLDGDPGYRASEHEIGQTLSTGFSIVVNAATEYPELVVKMIDYQYSDEIVDLTNWGIEGLTYTVDENGEKDYVDEIKNADLPSAKLAEYGVNQSMSCRSGMIFIPQLNDAASKLQKPNPYYYNGEFGEMVYWDFYTMTREDYDNVMPVDPPMTAFEDLENEDLSINKTALDTYVQEEYIKFIMGDRPLSEYDAFLAEMANYGDIDLGEEIYNSHIVTEE